MKMKYFLFFTILSASILFSFPTKVGAYATMDDFWNKRAVFEYQGQMPVSAGTDVVVKDGVWYMFERVYSNSVNTSVCQSGVRTDPLRIVVKTSTNRGQTWSEPIVIVDTVANTPYECTAADGHAYFDASNTTWHYLFQCMDRNFKWNICHATLQSQTPTAPFTGDSKNPVIKSGDLWSQICSSPTAHCNSSQIPQGRTVADEGTPEIVEKVGSDFYVTFHGHDGVNGYRGVAKTSDFANWSIVNNDAIFDKYDCQNWNVPWNSGGCIGMGSASTLKENGYYYTIVEAADMNLLCTYNQNWVFGLARSTSLESTSWNWFNNGSSAIVFNSQEKYADGRTVLCGVQYHKMFKDADGQIWFIYTAVEPFANPFSMVGKMFKLVSNGPVASYAFRGGPNYSYAVSDIISRGNLDAKINNASWTVNGSTYALSFNGTNSQLLMSDNPVFNMSNEATIEANLSIKSLPKTGSALLVGKESSYWLELYASGTLCFFVNTDGDHISHACKDNAFTLNNSTDIKGVYNAPNLALYINGVQVANAVNVGTTIKTVGTRFMAGGDGFSYGGSFGDSFDGQLNSLKVYNYATDAISIADTQAPTVPAGLVVTVISSSQINLTWSSSTDNKGVSGYKIYRDGNYIGTSATNGYSDYNILPSVTYSYSVSAYDASDNNSLLSSSVLVTSKPRENSYTIQTETTSNIATTSQANTATSSVSVSSQAPELLGTNLYLWNKGDQVKFLQKFLIENGYLPAGTPLGLFGYVTQEAVKKFQCKNGVVCSGGPYRTGYGQVGYKTRTLINSQIQSSGATYNMSEIEKQKEIDRLVAIIAELIKQIETLRAQKK